MFIKLVLHSDDDSCSITTASDFESVNDCKLLSFLLMEVLDVIILSVDILSLSAYDVKEFLDNIFLISSMPSAIYLRDVGRVLGIEGDVTVGVDTGGDGDGVSLELELELHVVIHDVHVNEKFGQFNSCRTALEGVLLLCHFSGIHDATYRHLWCIESEHITQVSTLSSLDTLH